MAIVPQPHELNPTSANKISTDNAELSDLLPSEKERLQQFPPPPSRLKIHLTSAKPALPILAIIYYLTFCFIVHYHNFHVPFGGNGDLKLPFYRSEQYHS